MQQGEHEIISDDGLMQLYFTQVDASNELLPAHWHEHLEMICMQHGAMTAYINETSYELQRGDILVVNPRDIHYTHVHGDGHYYLLQIPSEHLKRVSEDWRGLHFGEYVPYSEETTSVNYRMSQKLEEMKFLQEQAADGTHLLFLAVLYKLLYLLYTKDAVTVDHVLRHRSRRDFERIEQSMQYVKKNYTNPITLKETADELSLTPEYFCRLFKKYTGQTFLTYVNQIRLQYFHSDLLQTDESITYLMNKNGITNYKVFLRSFKEAYGMPPGQLRKKQREIRDAGAISARSVSSSGNDSKTETERTLKPRTPDN